MVNAVFRIIDYFHYLFVSKGQSKSHSPFLQDFIRNILTQKERFPGAEHIENIRRSMLKSPAILDFKDLGSGNRSGQRKLSEITANTAKAAKYGRVLQGVVSHASPQYALELGTGTGISTLYQATMLPESAVLHTIEGAEALIKIARHNAEKMDLSDRIVFHQGNFDDVMEQVLQEFPRIDYAFIDGNHTKDATLRYYDKIIPKCHKNSILVFDDIYWSEGMKEAWSYIKSKKEVVFTIDIFALGFVFFNPALEQKHIKLRY